MRKNKFIVEKNITATELSLNIKIYTNLEKNQVMFIFCGEKKFLIPSNVSIKTLYSKYKDPDGFLYILVSLESTYGYPIESLFTLAINKTKDFYKTFV